MSGRRVLLLEPNYHNKYPPMGLMKLASYHRLQGDDVVFFKGEFSRFVLTELTQEVIEKLQGIEQEALFPEPVEWRRLTPDIQRFIQAGKTDTESEFARAVASNPLAKPWLDSARKEFRSGGYFKKRRWDRVCVTTLFTFYWDITIETIKFAKKICKEPAQVLVGGILASVVPDKVRAATEIVPCVGPLHVKKLLNDKPLAASIDDLPLDYSILEEIDYKYPATDAYYAYTTRGCVNDCKFCAVPILEGGMKHYIPLLKRLEATNARFGEQRHLLLLDNNAFASKKFNKIIKEIRDSGFSRGASFLPPNQMDIAVRLLRKAWNDRAYIRMAVRLLNEFVGKLEGDQHDRFYGLLLNHGLLHDYTADKAAILAVYEEIKDEYEKARSRRPVSRYIDFNQGMDARLATPEKMAKLATVAIRPLRIAFDRWAERRHYVNAVYHAKQSGIIQMSNYLLYNFHDRPVDLYRRLLLNIDLCSALGVNIYSFPMKYHPIMDDRWFSNRDYICQPHWTRKSIRTVQSVLNATHGKIGRGRSFFFKAFGRNESEFLSLIRMPEAFILKRWDAELQGLTGAWRNAYTALSPEERIVVDEIVDTNSFGISKWKNKSRAICGVLDYYTIGREDIPLTDADAKSRVVQAFEQSCPSTISEECKRLLNAVGMKTAG
jgi:hypothetical protein